MKTTHIGWYFKREYAQESIEKGQRSYYPNCLLYVKHYPTRKGTYQYCIMIKPLA